MSRRWYFQSMVALVLGGLIIGGFWYLDETREHRECAYRLINPTRCENALRFTNPDFEPTRNLVAAEIAASKAKGVTSVAVAFRDLRNGPAFAIDQGENFLAMSLFKLPILIRYLKDAEGDPRILDEKITVSLSAEAINQNLSAEQTLTHGGEYTIRELLTRMVRYSDNRSRTALIEHYRDESHNPDYNVILDTLEELGIVDAAETGNPTLISVRSVASIFRMLYNASYLNLEQSEQALEWLGQANFDSGIAKPIPSSILVANKFGFNDEPTEKQLHDCGIIYYPQHPYILCVMTKGSDIVALETTIGNISKIIYDEFERRYGQ